MRRGRSVEGRPSRSRCRRRRGGCPGRSASPWSCRRRWRRGSRRPGPGSTVKLMPSRARTSPKRLLEVGDDEAHARRAPRVAWRTMEAVARRVGARQGAEAAPRDREVRPRRPREDDLRSGSPAQPGGALYGSPARRVGDPRAATAAYRPYRRVADSDGEGGSEGHDPIDPRRGSSRRRGSPSPGGVHGASSAGNRRGGLGPRLAWLHPAALAGQTFMGAVGGGLPWRLDGGRAKLWSDGRLVVEVEGLVLAAGANEGRNPAPHRARAGLLRRRGRRRCPTPCRTRRRATPRWRPW